MSSPEPDTPEAPDKAGTAPRRRRTIYIAAVALCLVAGLALRILGAWASRIVTDPDCGIVALMARHMAAGREFPVFFYGQDYMGSLEPAVSAVLCRLFGESGFMVCLGPALVGALALAVVFFWARAAGGPAAALAALAMCVVGPHYFFQFQFAPRGGYMMTLLLGMLVMWLSGNAANALWRRQAVSWRHFLLIGVAGGLAWWTNPLTAPALAVSAVAMLVGCRGRPPRGAWLGAIGFLIGSTPFWYWNVTHGWPTLTMTEGIGSISPAQGARYLLDRYSRLVGLRGWPQPLRVAAMVLPLLLAGAGLVLRAWRARRPRRVFNAHAMIVVLFLFLSAALFVRSGFARMNTARYLLPWVAPLAILGGWAVSALAARWGTVVGAIPVVLVLATQWPTLRDVHALAARVADQRHFDRHFEQFLNDHAITAAYGHYMNHAFNFRLGERIRFTTLTGERYLPIARDAELAERIAFLDSTGRFTDFLVTGGGSALATAIGGKRIDFHIEAPAGGRRRVAPSSIRDEAGRDVTPALTDGDRATAWERDLVPDGAALLEVTFSSLTTMRMLRVVGADERAYPRVMRVEGRYGTNAWSVIFGDHPVTPYYWSGPRPYADGSNFRLEYRLPDTPIDALRLVAAPSPRAAGNWTVCELQAFAADNSPGASREADALPLLFEALEANGVRRLYSDRWVANRVWQSRGGEVAVPLDPRAFPDGALRPGERLRWGSGTGLLVLMPDAAASRRVLEAVGITTREQTVGPWILFVASAEGDSRPPVVWAGFGCLRDDRVGVGEP